MILKSCGVSQCAVVDMTKIVSIMTQVTTGCSQLLLHTGSSRRDGHWQSQCTVHSILSLAATVHSALNTVTGSHSEQCTPYCHWQPQCTPYCHWQPQCTVHSIRSQTDTVHSILLRNNIMLHCTSISHNIQCHCQPRPLPSLTTIQAYITSTSPASTPSIPVN